MLKMRKNIVKLISMLSIVVFGVLMLTNIEALAATSDQVALSYTKPGAGYVISDNGLNVRSGMSTSTTVVASLPANTMVTIVGRFNNGWYKIQYDENGNYGYVSSSYIREYDLEYYCTVNAGGSPLYLRSGGGTSYGIIASIPDGQRIPELTYISTWDYVLYGTRAGYAKTSYLLRTHY